MKIFISVIIIIWVIVTIGILLNVLFTIRCFQNESEKLYQAYIDEAETLDDMAGLLEGLFDVTNPRQRRKCAHCTHVRQCVYTGKLPESDTVCECFDRREEYADY